MLRPDVRCAIFGLPLPCTMPKVRRMADREPHAWKTSLMDDITFVGLDVHKATVSLSVAESGRGDEVRQIGLFENRPEMLGKIMARPAKSGRRLSFCY